MHIYVSQMFSFLLSAKSLSPLLERRNIFYIFHSNRNLLKFHENRNHFENKRIFEILLLFL